jgi:hypothetical protein
MKSVLFHPVYIAAVVLASINQSLEYFGVYLPFIHSYLDDFLCFPIVLGTGLASYRIVFPNYRLTKWHIWPLFVVFVFVFEVYMPQISSLYIADVFDVLFYALGIFLFLKTINLPPKTNLALAAT